MEPQSVGNLKDLPMVELLLWVFEKSYSGAIVLAKDQIKKSIIVEQGRIISARSNIPEESLGQMLLDRGKITGAQLEKTLEMLEGKEALRQGEALLELGLIDHAYLSEILQEQLQNRIFSVFDWDDAKYGLVPRIPEDTARIVTDKTVPEFCFRGLIEKYKNSPELEEIDLEFKPNVIGGSKLTADKLRLVGREMGFFRSITGVNTTGVILEKSRMEKNLSKAMLLAFRDLDLIRMKPEKKRSGGGAGDHVGHSRPTQTKSGGESKRPATGSSEGMKLVLKKLEEIEGKTLYEVLGVDRKANSTQIKAAYFQLAKIFHPDRISGGVSPEERKHAEALFAKITEANSTLSNDATRKEYDASLDLEKSGITANQATEILESEVNFQKGLAAIRKGDFGGAVSALEEAIKLYDQEPEYYLNLGWALFRRSAREKKPQDFKRGKELVEKAVSKNPKLGQGHYFLGMIYKAEGSLDRAKRMFEQALEIAPHHNEASSELRLMNMRREKDKSGGLKGLFRKKT